MKLSGKLKYSIACLQINERFSCITYHISGSGGGAHVCQLGGGVGGELESCMLVSHNTSFRPPLNKSQFYLIIVKVVIHSKF